MKLLLTAVLLSATIAHAAPLPAVETVYIKNNSSDPAYVWVNKFYQGGVAPGQTYSFSAAGVNLEDGSHAAGWEPRRRLGIRVISFNENEGMTLWSGHLKVFNLEAFLSAGSGPHARVYFGGTVAEAPSDWDIINSTPCVFVPSPAAATNADQLARPNTGGSITITLPDHT